MAPMQLIFGASSFGESRIPTTETAKSFLDVLKKYSVKQVDTAYIYPGFDQMTASERILGDLGAGSTEGFVIDTKADCSAPNCQSYDNLMKTIPEQVSRLGVQSVNILYLHFPDTATAFEETHPALNDLYVQGRFKYLGLSNFKIDQVQVFLDNAEKRGWVRPTVYQGMYNIVARRIEEDLLPFLKEKGIVFYAYSPLAGGFFSNIKRGEAPQSGSRYDADSSVGQLSQKTFYKDSYFAAGDKLRVTGEKFGLTSNEIAFRWLLNHSFISSSGDAGVLIGASRISQLEENLRNVENAAPLPVEVLRVAEELWELVEKDAPYFSYLDNN
ncbi:NADP-dependent oxidoreductase domain-containing protein [Lipomyces tetrasporus]|uniref:NADP-dependent oxidoreductase domain-containing protein n=1 Tax=Lipomyces tetrasporus TaxID=54092 RepID=A0AAD7VTL0_9ASCO|nr:NADP-dependent oxidoreductase domain-containing protein [Lipomyces tetrasporus]KAJ8100854.1 NADP-dependent oxidoreductase domain-containing protein [Lipomyces tetrasporus]